MTTLVVFVSCSKLAECLHVPFFSIETRHPVICFAGLLFLFEILCMLSFFQVASFGDLLLNEKQKKPFVSLKAKVTITQLSLTAASLAQVDNALNEADSNLFSRDTQGLDSRSVKSFFSSSVFLFLLKTFFVSL